MPKFHTKTIESILEPVAQQVSKLVELQEDADNNFDQMPDLSQPVECVKIAGDNLIRVGYETCDSSDDAILKDEMPLGLKCVQEACESLEMAVKLFRQASTYTLAKKKLIDGERGILQGISSILLTFDESQVRKIIQFCNQLQDYFSVTQAIANIDELVVYIRNLTPIITRVAQEVEQRQAELTNQQHRNLLKKHLDDIKYLTPLLISSLKTFIILRLSNAEPNEAIHNKEHVIQSLLFDVKEIIRVLKLSSDEDDSISLKNYNQIREKFNQFCDHLNDANDWLYGDENISDLNGEQALKNALEKGELIASFTGDNQKYGRIKSIIHEIQSLSPNLSSNGQRNYQIASKILDNFVHLYDLLKRVVGDTNGTIKESISGVYSKLEKIAQWCSHSVDINEGKMAAKSLLDEAHDILKDNQIFSENNSFTRNIHDFEVLVEKLYAIRVSKSTKIDSRAIEQELNHKTQEIVQGLVNFHAQKYADDFIDVNFPLRKLFEIASSPFEAISRDEILKRSIDTFINHSNILAKTAKNTSLKIQNSFNKKKVDEILDLIKKLSAITPQVVNAAEILFKQPTNQVFFEHFDLIKTQWFDVTEKIRNLIDSNIDVSLFIKSCEYSIIRDTLKTELAVSKRNPLEIVTNASNIARRANRVIQIAQQEIDNSEDNQYVNQIKHSSEVLKACVPLMVHQTKELAQQPDNKVIFEKWSLANKNLLESVGEVKEAISNEINNFEDLSSSRSSVSTIGNVDSFNSHKDVTDSDQVPPERPPPPKNLYPEKPHLINLENESECIFDLMQPQNDEPILKAAHSLHQNINQWSSKDNDMISKAKKITLLMAKLNDLINDKKSFKKELITTAKEIAAESMEITRLAKELAANCTNKRMKMNLLQVCERIPTIGTQLKILSTVKATLLGAHGTREDDEATEMLICNAQNLDASIRETIEAAKSASIRVRTDSGIRLKWIRKKSSFKKRMN